MSSKASVGRITLMLVLLMVLTSCDRATPATPQQAAIATLVSSPLPAATNPAPLPTPQATDTVLLPTPGLTVEPPTFTPDPTAPSVTPMLPTPPTPPTAIALSTEPISSSTSVTPLVWGAQANSVLTIWLGYLSSMPTPALSDAHPIVQISGIYFLDDIKVSPDLKRIAVLVEDNANIGEAGDNNRWVVVADLNTNAPYVIPDYSRQAYSYTTALYIQNILAWISNDKIAVQGKRAVTINAADGTIASQCSTPPGNLRSDTMALSADHTTLFYWIVSVDSYAGYWLQGLDCSNPHKIVADADTVAGMAFPSWSPDGRYISFVSGTHLWLLDTNDNSVRMTPADRVATSAQYWSPDSKYIAFLRDNDLAHPGSNTDVFMLRMADMGISQLTSSGGHKGNLQWSADASQIIFDNSDSIVATSTKDGQPTNLISRLTGTTISRPTLFR